MALITWTRGSGTQLTPHFHAKEFECSCGICRDQRIDRDLVIKLEDIRQGTGQSMHINSGFRCARKQQMLRDAGYETSVGPSSHESGQAADISSRDIPALLVEAEKKFSSIGVAHTFLHVDLRPGKRRWTYK